MLQGCLRYIIPVCFFLFFLLAVLPSCTHEPDNLEALDKVCFDSLVLPMLQSSCGNPSTNCHRPGGTAEGFDASNYATISRSVSPGDPRGSKLYNVITTVNGEDLMPPGQPLSEYNRSIIHIWIAQGADTLCN